MRRRPMSRILGIQTSTSAGASRLNCSASESDPDPRAPAPRSCRPVHIGGAQSGHRLRSTGRDAPLPIGPAEHESRPLAAAARSGQSRHRIRGSPSPPLRNSFAETWRIRFAVPRIEFSRRSEATHRFSVLQMPLTAFNPCGERLFSAEQSFGLVWQPPVPSL